MNGNTNEIFLQLNVTEEWRSFACKYSRSIIQGPQG